MNLIERLQHQGNGAIECGRGWFPLLDQLDQDLSVMDPDYVIEQVKEKFGTLRFYAQTSNHETVAGFFARIHQAEKESERTCEDCGKPGQLSDHNGWYRTMCPECQGEKEVANAL